MRRLSMILLLGCCTSVTFAQRQRVEVIDGQVTITGPIQSLRGIQVRSTGGFLSLDRFEVPGTDVSFPRTEPFPSAAIIANTAHHVALVATPSSGAIDIEGTTVTSIRYLESNETAFRQGDLSVSLGIDDTEFDLNPFCNGRLFCPEPSGGPMCVGAVIVLAAVRRRRTGS